MTFEPSTLLMTRHARGNAAFVGLLPAACRERVRVIESPLIEIVPARSAPPACSEFAAIFTSANGVRHAPPGEGRTAFCVGARTAEEAQAAGWQARLAGLEAEALLATLLAERPGLPIVHFGGRHQRGDIAERLAAAGLDARRCIVYDQTALPLTERAKMALLSDNVVIVPLFSPRTASLFAGSLSEKSQPLLVGMSPAVAHALPVSRRSACRIAAVPSAEAMVAEVEKLIARRSLG